MATKLSKNGNFLGKHAFLIQITAFVADLTRSRNRHLPLIQ